MEYILCDVFTDQPLAGNPLAVFLGADHMSAETMQALAREFGWSEVTFVLFRTPGSPRVRIWTPAGELPFAGHPIIGTAVVLAAAGRIESGWTNLEVGIGPVAVEVARAMAFGGRASMTQRAPAFGSTFRDRPRLAGALGLREEDLVPELPAQVVSTGLEHFLVPVRSLAALSRATATSELAAVTAEMGTRWAYLFSSDTPESMGVRARLLAAGMEDPATGSAAGPLGAYLVRYGVHRSGVIDVEQGIEMGRPSRIEVEVPQEGGELGPIRVSGEVRIWARGTLQVEGLASPML